MNYAFYYNGKRHTNTNTDYLIRLGMDKDAIDKLQASAIWNSTKPAH